MPAPRPPEFRRRAVELARRREQPIAQIAKDLGISESCLRRWMDRSDVDEGRKEGLSSDERRELVELRRRNRVLETQVEILERASAYFARENILPKLGFRLVRECAADGIPVAVACRVLKVSRAGYYQWRDRPPSARAVADAELTATIRRVHETSRGTYGAPRVHAELRLGLAVRCGRKRVARLMGAAGPAGVCHRRTRGRARPLPAPHADLVQRRVVAEAPNRLWVTDITEHPTGTGKVYCAAVLYVFSRVVVGWSIADHVRAELVVDAPDMARWRRRSPTPTAHRHDRGVATTS
jgi:transposase-like protein